MKLKGKTILISGAAKRIGEALAKACAERGANLLLHAYRSTEEVKKIAKTLKRKKISIHTFQTDLSLVEEVEKLIQSLLNQKLIPDIIIHNASLFYPQKLSETKLTDIDQFFNIHFKAPFLINQTFGPLMKKKGEGHILHFIDAGILNPHPSYMAYSASKAALLNYSLALAKELAPQVQVNCISPGQILAPTHYTTKQKQTLIQKTLSERFGGVEEISKMVLSLLESNFITGQNFLVDGGRK